MLRALTLSTAIAALALSAVAVTPAAAMEKIVRCTKANKEKIMKMAEQNPNEAMMKKSLKLVAMAGKMASAGDIPGCREDLMKARKAAETK
jgi:hypothetical protein